MSDSDEFDLKEALRRFLESGGTPKARRVADLITFAVEMRRPPGKRVQPSGRDGPLIPPENLWRLRQLVDNCLTGVANSGDHITAIREDDGRWVDVVDNDGNPVVIDPHNLPPRRGNPGKSRDGQGLDLTPIADAYFYCRMSWQEIAGEEFHPDFGKAKDDPQISGWCVDLYGMNAAGRALFLICKSINPEFTRANIRSKAKKAYDERHGNPMPTDEPRRTKH